MTVPTELYLFLPSIDHSSITQLKQKLSSFLPCQVKPLCASLIQGLDHAFGFVFDFGMYFMSIVAVFSDVVELLILALSLTLFS